MKLFTTILLLLFVSGSFAMGNGLSLNNVGSKAFGMAGAFTGIADDYSAVYWNPGGLTQLKGGQVVVFITDVAPSPKYKYDAAQVDASGEVKHYISPNFFAYNQYMDGDLTIGLAGYVPAGIGAEWSGEELKNLTNGAAMDWESMVFTYNIAPTIAYKINDMFSVGAALNINYGSFELKRPQSTTEIAGQYSEEGTGWGFGFNVGVLAQVCEKIRVGVNYRSEMSVAFEGTAKFAGYHLKQPTQGETDYTRDLAWPQVVSGGVAIKPVEALTVAFDVQWHNWSATQDKIETEYKSLDYLPKDMNLHWDDAIQYRVGLNYELNKAVQLRCGYYYDPSPAPDKTMNVAFPSNTFNSANVGASYAFSSFMIDFAAEYCIGTDRDVARYPSDQTVIPTNMPGVHSMNVLGLSLGMTWFFNSQEEK
jgi:long-chain fatty acid transport protein